jgi:hypothetical protein
MTVKRIGGLLCAATLACAAASASAQLAAVYRQIDPAGHIVITDQLDPAPASEEAAPEVEPAPVPARPKVSSRRAALVNLNEAQRRLAQAQLKRKHGAAPLARERVQGASGETVGYAYWKRQEKLRIAVEQAQQRVNALQRPLLAHQ